MREDSFVPDSGGARLYEHRFHEAMVRKYDYLELFGADIPRESQRHSLSVAYVTLNLCQEEDEIEVASEKKSTSLVNERGLPFIGARPVAEVFDLLGSSSGRLLVRGVAGGGKSTLLRWAAIECSKFNLQESNGEPNGPDPHIDAEIESTELQSTSSDTDWRKSVPFLIRLRDCTDGLLPRPKDWPTIVAKELPDAPSDWIDNVLTRGRALVLFDGVDEVPVLKREILAREIENLVAAYPQNYWLVSTRPGAVSSGWLSKLDFLEARIEPMSLADQDEFIDKWYSAVAAELRSTARRAENLQKVALSLKQELRETSNIARLAIYPLLCAMVCALYRERNQKLPETQAAICEDLCKMLLHRRERETPDLSLIHLPSDYKKLDYEHKKYIMAELAKFMVEKGISAIEEKDADSLIAAALTQFPDHVQADPSEMRKAFIERSGLLRPSGTDRIDFLHNTLKEYLAAWRFVAEDQYRLLSRRAVDDTWQPVVLFAAALPTPGFASSLVGELFKRLPKKSGSKAEGNRSSTKRRAAEFFLVRCRNAAFRLDPALVQRINRLAAGLFPPSTIADAEVLASLGEMVVPHLNPSEQKNARQKVACIRALRLIGGTKAKTFLKNFAPGRGKAVLAELLGAAADLQIRLKLTVSSLDLSLTSVSDLSPLAASNTLHTLSLAKTRVTSAEPLSRLRGLQSLDLSCTHIPDLSSLHGLKNLKLLDLFESHSSLRSINGCRGLHALRIGRNSSYGNLDGRRAFLRSLNATFKVLMESGFSRFMASSYPRNRISADFQGHHVMHASRVFSFLNSTMSATEAESWKPWLPLLADLDCLLGSIRHLDFEVLKDFRERLEQFEPLLYDQPYSLSTLFSSPSALRDLLERADRAPKRESLLTPLGALKNLRLLVIDAVPIFDLKPLLGLTRLEALLMNYSVCTNLSPLARLTELRWLELIGSFATDFSPLAKLKRLRILDLSETSVADLSWVGPMKNLETLNVAYTQVRDLEPLIESQALRMLLVSLPNDRESAHSMEMQLRQLARKNERLRIINLGTKRRLGAKRLIYRRRSKAHVRNGIANRN